MWRAKTVTLSSATWWFFTKRRLTLWFTFGKKKSCLFKPTIPCKGATLHGVVSWIWPGCLNQFNQRLEDKLTSRSQKLRRVLLLVGVVDSGVLLPVAVAPPAVWDKLIGDGLLLKTREPLRCLGTSLTSLTSGEETKGPKGIQKDLCYFEIHNLKKYESK